MILKQGALLQGGTYRIERYINSGGFGCTYEAQHTMLEKRVAIKEFFVKDFCNRDEATAHVTVATQGKRSLVDKLRRKFVDEAKALARMRHPGIVNVSDVFEENSTAYYVMDYIDGSSLQEILNHEGRLSGERALSYIRQVADALSYVHQQKRLHLDIKPGNIMVDTRGNAVLIDFGASKQYDELDGENTSTVQGYTKGFAPPEQMTNDVVKFMPATDVYALGATLYKLLTGVTPPSATLRISGEGLAALPASVCAATANAIEQAMCLNKMQRPQSIEEFLALLDAPDKEVPVVMETEEEHTEQFVEEEGDKRDTPKETPSPSAKPMAPKWTVMYGKVVQWAKSLKSTKLQDKQEKTVNSPTGQVSLFPDAGLWRWIYWLLFPVAFIEDVIAKKQYRSLWSILYHPWTILLCLSLFVEVPDTGVSFGVNFVLVNCICGAILCYPLLKHVFEFFNVSRKLLVAVSVTSFLSLGSSFVVVCSFVNVIPIIMGILFRMKSLEGKAFTIRRGLLISSAVIALVWGIVFFVFLFILFGLGFDS